MINKQINDKNVRVETTAMLQNPTDFSQTELLFRFGMLKIEARMTDYGDVVVDPKFTNELVKYEFMDKDMEEFIWSRDNVDKIIFVHNFILRA